MKSKQEKLNFLTSIKKETEIHSILEEILPEMGFSDVKVTHEKGNKPEFGKDLVCSYLDEIEDKKDWFAFVVKKGKVSGSTGVVREIENQVFECFKYPYKSLEQTKKIPINKVKIITNEHFSSGAKDKIFDSNNDERANIDFWDGEKLIYFIDKYYPKFWVRGSKQYKKYIERLQERIKTDNTIKSLSIDNKKVEKLLNNMIEPKLSERITNEDGSIKWISKKADTIINLPHNSLIIGEPGCGKSTLFKTLSNEIITQNSLRNNQDFYPIILTFKEIEQADFDLEIAIEGYFNKDWNVDLGIDSKAIIKTENCAVFIDALDELAKKESKEKALQSVADFNEKFPNIKVICSSRPSDYLFHNSEAIGFRYMEVNDLNRQQIELFLSNYFSEDLIKSKSLLKSLKDSEILEKLPKTPLTIALITMLFDEKEIEIPATITDLYELFVNLLIGKTTSTETTELIEVGIKHRILCYVAKDLHTNLKSSISKSELKDLILKYSTERGQKFDIGQVLEEILDQIGLLFINDKGEISFKHQSFQEYFTAYEIFHHRQSDRKLFIDKFNNLWWQNVAIFYAGMAKDSPKFLEEVLENSKPKNLAEYISNTGGLGKLLQALYNTPIEQRKKGIQRGLENTSEILKLVSKAEATPDRKDLIFWQNFSTYGLMQIFGGWFKHNNWSITLKEPMAEYFDDNIKLLDSETTDEEEFNLEFQLFLVSSILASDSFIDFDRFKELVDKSKLSNLDILAILDTHYKTLMKHLPKSYRKDATLNSIHKKLRKRIQTNPDFADEVNKPINKRKLE
ncbi:NACHT domain-containing protein [Psychroflexus sp. CAK8W]|uniref:NACHT domain-containing protein n=1 Tax=Psychroflexus longus TaxID=2873596 RepID=A0ABS7XLK0_9FLAO|nr:NACHT domain-containing protein [Psychroflexus longus]MBZ9779857.1 NACHT domain-containing protein [Psychroflexus longus]